MKNTHSTCTYCYNFSGFPATFSFQTKTQLSKTLLLTANKSNSCTDKTGLNVLIEHFFHAQKLNNNQ